MQIIDSIFINIDVKMYYLQHQLSVLIFYNLSSVTPLTFVIVLVAGVLTSLNPCLLSILPLSVSYLYSKSNNLKLRNKVMFLVGIASSLIGMILMTSLLSQQYYGLISKIPLFSSIFTIFIGLNLLQIINFYNLCSIFNNLYCCFNIRYLQSYTIGLILGLSSMPCSTSILFTILAWSLYVKYWLLGLTYLLIYCLGYITPLILLINWALNYNQVSNIIKSWNYIIPVSGSYILGLGVFSLLEKIFI